MILRHKKEDLQELQKLRIPGGGGGFFREFSDSFFLKD